MLLVALMSKTLETKRKILILLRKKEMTISELSGSLGLSAATISQHLDELRSTGAIERIENEHFRKLKYYRAKETAAPIATNYVKYVIAAMALLAVFSGAYIYGGAHDGSLSNLSNGSSIRSMVTGGPGAYALACPLRSYELTGQVTGQSGFSTYSLSYPSGNYVNYVLMPGSSGEIRVTEHVTALPEQANASLAETPLSHSVVVIPATKGLSTNPPSAQGAYGGAAASAQVANVPAAPSGLAVSIAPANYTLAWNRTINVTVSIAASSTAAGTYWLEIDGPCGGPEPVLLTLEYSPYGAIDSNGTAK
ncbi:Bacterial regulatory protein, arsR family [uncultured archaeon]|nr:Bacterial regulatory protein, arsR family [uncultured archaeon]